MNGKVTDNAARGEKVKPEKGSTLTPMANAGTFYPPAEWLSMHEAHRQLAAQGHADILLLGDSIHYGWNWPGRPEIWQKHFPGFSVANLAISGDYIQHLLWRIENGNLAAFSPATVILLIGANNIDDYSATEIAKGIMKILNRVKRECGGAKIILTGLFPRGQEPDTPLRRKIIAVNALLEKLSDGERVFFHNPGPALLEHDGSMTRKMFYDFSHPNLAGYARWAEMLSCMDIKFSSNGKG